MRTNSRYARRNPFGAARYDIGGPVQSNVGSGGPGPMPRPGWSGTSQGGFGGSGKGGGYGMGGFGGMGMPGQAGMNQNYGPGFGQQQGQGFSVPWGYFNQMQQYNPLLYAGFASMLPRPWQYGNPSPAPLFQSQNTFNQYTPPQQQQPSGGGGGGFSILPNFDQNGQIISIPQGVTWGTPSAGGAPNWIYQGSHTSQEPIPGFGNPAAGTPLNQYTGPGPWSGGTPPPAGGPGTGQQNTTGPFSMAGSAGPTPMNPWEGVGGMHAARGGAVEGRGGGEMQSGPFDDGMCDSKGALSEQMRLIDANPCVPPRMGQQPLPGGEQELYAPDWVPADQPTEHMDEKNFPGMWLKRRL